MRPPDLVIIGAMKAGTTTMHSDLSARRAVRIAEKELGLLRGADTKSGRRRYLAQWQGAGDDELLADVSASYSMLPHEPGLAEVLFDLNPRARIAYLCREPLARIRSHHHYELTAGRTVASVDEAVRSDTRFVDYSRYDRQLAAWARVFGWDAVRPIHFESYVAERAEVVTALLRWCGVDSTDTDPLAAASTNATGDAARVVGPMRKLVESPSYRRVLRPLAPTRLRRVMGRRFMATPSDRPAPPTPETAAWLHRELQDDVARLSRRTRGEVSWPGW